MGLLKSVIADARPAKSMQRAHTSPATVSGQIPAVLSTDSARMKSASRQTEGFMQNQTQVAHIDVNTRSQDVGGQLSGLSDKQENHNAQTGAQTQSKIRQGPYTQSRQNLPRQKTTHHANESGNARTTHIKNSDRFLQSKSELPSFTIKSTDQNAGSSDSGRTKSRPFEQNLPSDADTDFAAQQMPLAKVTNQGQAKTVNQFNGVQNPLQTGAKQKPFDDLDTGLSTLAHKDDKESPSGLYDNLLPHQSSADKSFEEFEFERSRVNVEANKPQRAHAIRQHIADTSAQNVTLNIESGQYPDARNHKSQHTDSPPVIQAIEKAESETQSSEDRLAAVAARMHDLDPEVHKQKEKEAGMEVIAAGTVNITGDQFASQQADSHRSTSPVQVTQGSAEVRIGQVDVFIEKPAASSAPLGRSIRPSIAMASRYYLRRL